MPPKDSPNERVFGQESEADVLRELDFQPEAAEQRAERALDVATGWATASPEGKVNEDRVLFLPDGSAVLADGVGSKEDSTPAANLATSELINALATIDRHTPPNEAEQLIASELKGVHKAIRSMQKTGKSMAAAVSLMKPLEEEDGRVTLLVLSVGDVSVYRMRDGKLEEITDYHENPPEKPKPALGADERAIPKAYFVPVEDGDTYLLASNGLRKNDPSMESIEEIMAAQSENPDVAATQLVNRVVGRSGDSRTAFVARYSSPEHKGLAS